MTSPLREWRAPVRFQNTGVFHYPIPFLPDMTRQHQQSAYISVKSSAFNVSLFVEPEALRSIRQQKFTACPLARLPLPSRITSPPGDA